MDDLAKIRSNRVDLLDGGDAFSYNLSYECKAFIGPAGAPPGTHPGLSYKCKAFIGPAGAPPGTHPGQVNTRTGAPGDGASRPEGVRP